MDLNLDDIQEMIRDTARRFLGDEISSERVRQIAAEPDGFCRDLWAQMVELGWAAMTLPESLGGGGRGVLDLCLLAEETGRVAASTPLVVSSGLAARLLQNPACGPMAETLLGRLAAGAIITVALMAADSRNERADPSTDLRLQGDRLLLSGTKVLVPYATIADVLLVTANLPDGTPAIIVVDPGADTGGGDIAIARHNTIGGDPKFSVTFTDIIVADHQILLRGEDARAALADGLGIASLLSVAEAVGAAESVLNLTAEHAAMRSQYGTLIGAYQAVSHPCADMRIEIDACRLLMQEAAWCADQGRAFAADAASTKAYANEALTRIAQDGLRLHGAIGYSNEYDLQLHFRNLRTFCVTYGETEDQLALAASSMVG